jgi:PAS domain S-box-containing protein
VGSTSSGRALILEVDAQRGSALAAMLETEGYRSVQMQGVGAALAVSARVPFEIVLLGTVPPDHDRATVCRAIRQMSNSTLLVLVPHDDPALVDALLDAGASDVIPSDPLNLASLVRLRVRIAKRRGGLQSHAEAMLHAMPDVVFRLSGSGEYLAFHASSTHKLYMPPDQIVGRLLEEALPGELAQRVRVAMRQALDTGELQVLKYTLELAQGPGEFEARLVPSGPDEVLAIVRDINDRKQAETLEVANSALGAEIAERRRAESALRGSEAQWRSLVENCPDFVVTIDPTGRITFLNRPIPGVGPGGGVGATVLDIAPAGAREQLIAALDRVFVRGEPDAFEVLGDPSSYTAFEIRVSPIGTPPDIHSAVVVARDITERRSAEAERARMQERLLTAQKLDSLGMLAGGIAHDFNNLLTAILGGASIALLKLPDAAPARRSIETLVAAARRASELTQQLLAYSGRGKFHVRTIDLSENIRELVLVLEAAIPKRVTLLRRLAPDLPAVQVDVGQIQQVIMNLVINAAEAIGDRPGTIVLTTGRQPVDETYVATLFPGESLVPGDHVFVEVHDDGCGMSPETIAKAFDPFFTTKTKGRGLGLAAVQGIIRSHHGALKIYSTPGRGTTFKVLMPASTSPVEVQARDVAPPQASGATVLVVDDEPLLRGAARQIVQHFGYTALEAADGREAVAIFREKANEISIVLLDMTMPGMSGEETFQELRRIKPDACVVLSSGYNEIEATRRFTADSLAAFLQKPYTAEQLGQCLARVDAARSR